MCYIFRLAWLKRGPKLHYRLNEGQAVAMMDAVHTASEMGAASGGGQTGWRSIQFHQFRPRVALR
jgi:hypothetical protein